MKMLDDPFGGQPVVACRALVPDVALVHAHLADRYGNIQYKPSAVWPDIGIMPHAAKKVIVSVEEIVDTEVLRQNPDRTILAGFTVDAVVEIPFGAHPTSFFPAYGYDSEFHHEWTAVSRDRDDANTFLDKFVREPSSQEAYLNLVGGEAKLKHLENWEEDN